MLKARMSRPIFGFYLTLVSIVLLLSGCGSPPWNDPYAGHDDDAVGPTIYSSFSERPKHLDPARSYAANEWAFISQIYEPPLQYHFLKRPYELTVLAAAEMPTVKFFNEVGNPLPPDTDPSEVAYSDYTIRIQPGIKYQPHPAFAKTPDGEYRYWPMSSEAVKEIFTLSDFDATDSRELTAEDYVYQIKRIAFAPNHSPIAGLMSEHIRGLSEFAEKTKMAFDALRNETQEKNPWLDLRNFEMAGVRVVDRYSYKIRINGVYPQFMYWLAMNFFAPMPWEADRFYRQPGMKERNLTLHWYPVGTGPFMLTENNPNLRMVLELNPNYHGEAYPADGSEEDRSAGLLDDAGKAMPFLTRAIYSLEKEAIPRWNKFLQGYYDNSGISSDSFDQAVQIGTSGEATLTDEMRARGIQLSTAVETSIFYTGFNMKDPVVGGNSERARLLRHAIAIAFDMEEFISIFRNGRGESAQSPLPPGIFGYRGGVEGIDPNIYEVVNGKIRRKPLAAAKELLRQAGYPNGRDPNTGGPLILYYDTAAAGPEYKAMMDWYRKQFEKIGIELVIRATDYNRFQDKMLKATAQIYSWGWNADYPDPENFFFLLYGPSSKADHQGENASNYSNPEFDRLFDRMKNLPNTAERQAIIDEMIGILRYDLPWIWGFFPKGFSLHHSWYGNALPHLMANNTLKYKRIDSSRRAEKQREWNQPITWPLKLLGAVFVVSLIPAAVGFYRRERRAAR